MDEVMSLQPCVPVSPEPQIEAMTRQLCRLLEDQPTMESIAVRFSRRVTRNELISAANIAHEHDLRLWPRYGELVLECKENPTPPLVLAREIRRVSALRTRGGERCR